MTKKDLETAVRKQSEKIISLEAKLGEANIRFNRLEKDLISANQNASGLSKDHERIKDCIESRLAVIDPRGLCHGFIDNEPDEKPTNEALFLQHISLKL